MPLRPIPQPHIQVVNEKSQGTSVWREYWEAVDRFLRTIGVGGGATVGLEFHGGGLVLSPNTKAWIKIPFDCEILSWTATAGQTGSVQVDLWVDTYGNFPPTNDDSITASAPITISGGVKNSDDTLTGWTKEISAGSYLMANIDSVTNIQDLVIEIEVEK